MKNIYLASLISPFDGKRIYWDIFYSKERATEFLNEHKDDCEPLIEEYEKVGEIKKGESKCSK